MSTPRPGGFAAATGPTTAPPATPPAEVGAADVIARVQEQIDSEISRQRRALAELGPEVAPLVDAVAGLLRGGKRLRARFCHQGYLAGGGQDGPAIVRAATAMEFFQAAALLHDDVMDNSDTRRGAPAAHKLLQRRHEEAGWQGDAERFGAAGAILAGDLCLVWTDEIFAGCGLPTEDLAAARPHFDAMRAQLMAGQFLDILVGATGWDELDTAGRVALAARVVRYKSAKYSIEQPLLIGAAAAGLSQETLSRLSAYGLALGEAFQLRDDLLGVFGDPAQTGKPAGDDLAEGKRTMLLAYAFDTTDATGASVLRDGLGRADLSEADVERMREVITASGAVDRIEEKVAAGRDEALAQLAGADGLTDAGRAGLVNLAYVTTARTS